MPELPEVETVKRTLAPQLVGAQIESVDIARPEVVAHPSADEFCSALAGQTITGMGRRGKFLQLGLQSGDAVALHLRMTGCLLLAPAGYPLEKHTHVVFHLNGSRQLRFIDTRRFGRFWLLRAGEEDTFTGMGKLGIEPLDGGVTAKYLQNAFGKSRRSIKQCLLDQEAIAGIGNIYSDEILFTAKIQPGRPANSLNAQEWQRLAEAIPERLAFFVARNQISPREYLAGGGQDYRNTPFLQVYGHGGEACPTCGKPLSQKNIGGRSSVFCLACQA